MSALLAERSVACCIYDRTTIKCIKIERQKDSNYAAANTFKFSSLSVVSIAFVDLLNRESGGGRYSIDLFLGATWIFYPFPAVSSTFTLVCASCALIFEIEHLPSSGLSLLVGGAFRLGVERSFELASWRFRP